MVQISSEITGLRELARNSDKLKKSFGTSTLRPALRAVGSLVGRGARKRVEAVSTGRLRRRGINWRVRRFRRDGEGHVDVGWTVDAFYGGFIELGTSQHRAQPHLRPELEDAHQSGRAQETFVEQLNKTIMRVLGRL